MYSIVRNRVESFDIFLLFCFSILLLVPAKIKSQIDYPLEISYYDFIQYENDKFEFPGDSSAFERFFYKMDTLMLHGTGKITIVHIGGSHIQADIYSGRTRARLQTFYPGMNGGRGMVFPYRIANSNSPRTYSFQAQGNWSNCKNVDLNKLCNLGLTGIALITSDSLSSIDFHLRTDSLPSYSFDRIRVFHSMDSISYIPVIDGVKVLKSEKNKDQGYSLFYLDDSHISFRLKLMKTAQSQQNFELYGISLENDDPGIIYHSIGVNGASFPSFLQCNLLEKNLSALKPDLVIISLGTNDAYTTKFRPDFYRANYEEMIEKIKRAAPLTAILNTVANDSYLYRRYPNKNTKSAAEVIYNVAEKYDCGVWDLYKVMGGFNSSALWRKQNLMVRDMVHFNEKGYLLIGDLLFNAFIKSYDNHINSLIRK